MNHRLIHRCNKPEWILDAHEKLLISEMFSHWMNQQASNILNQDSFPWTSLCITHAWLPLQCKNTGNSSSGYCNFVCIYVYIWLLIWHPNQLSSTAKGSSLESGIITFNCIRYCCNVMIAKVTLFRKLVLKNKKKGECIILRNKQSTFYIHSFL